MEQRKLQLAVDEATSQGRYANLCAVSSGDSEFVLDFAFVQPGIAKAKVHSRVILSPQQAKQLSMVLATRVAAYEERKGNISLPVISNALKH